MAEAATVARLVELLRERYPELRDGQAGFRVAVNRQYADLAAPLHDGDEVALIPPVSGGGPFRVTRDPIGAVEVGRAVSRPANGGIVIFLGVVRAESRGKPVLRLEYDAYPEMVEAQLVAIGAEIAAQWPDTDVAIVHRIGTLEIGEVAVAIAVGAPHRADAFEACRYAIDRIKHVAPIWKKEVFADGEVWVGEEAET